MFWENQFHLVWRALVEQDVLYKTSKRSTGNKTVSMTYWISKHNGLDGHYLAHKLRFQLGLRVKLKSVLGPHHMVWTEKGLQKKKKSNSKTKVP